MIRTAIDTFYLTDEQLENSPSRKDGIDKITETTLRIYGCDLIQGGGILLRLPQAVMAFLIVFHRMECRREKLPPLDFLDTSSILDLKQDLVRIERQSFERDGFCLPPHKLISIYLATLETPTELRQEAWNLATDSLRTTLRMWLVESSMQQLVDFKCLFLRILLREMLLMLINLAQMKFAGPFPTYIPSPRHTVNSSGKRKNRDHTAECRQQEIAV